MTKNFALGAALALATLAVSVPAHAVDPWEGGSGPDDTSATINALSPGLAQQHDLDQAGGGNDVDWALLPTLQYHSYEARISGGTVSFDLGRCPTCAQFERVNGSGTVLTEDVGAVNNGSYDRSVRWLASGSTIMDYIRVTGSSVTENATHVYTLRYRDTTYTVPRWNSAGGQVTVFVITSLDRGTVTGNVHFFTTGSLLHPSSTSTLLHSQAITLYPNEPLVLNTAAIAPLAGQSGYALVSHTAGYGGLTGKAVALEPSTGFTFDTAMAPIPQ